MSLLEKNSISVVNEENSSHDFLLFLTDSQQPSFDRLSVTFAEPTPAITYFRMHQQQSIQEYPPYPEELIETLDPIENDETEEEDYSASVNAIIQSRASIRRTKKSNRRTSSPLALDSSSVPERRASVFTTSSGDTAITVDDNQTNEMAENEIFENIKLHKEVLSNVKMQPWSMRKKVKLVLQAKSYIKKHEGQLQERLAQSHSTKDMLARWNIMLVKQWQKSKRELTNISMWFIPWELKIKEIESHFGSVVASYFIFLRWLFWVNIVIAVVIISFVTIPEIITADPQAVKDRKYILPEEKYNSTNLLTLWDFEGVFKYSPLFYGWYTNRDYNESAVLNGIDKKTNQGHGYRLPFAYFVTGLMVYAYSFFATLRKMAENSRMSKLSEKDDECIFSWKVFTAWDYMIGNAETAHNRVASIVTGFKEALLEETEKQRESRNWKVIGFRILVNTLVLGLLSFSAFAVIIVVKRSTEPEANSTVWRRNEITVVMSLISLCFPMMFEVLGLLEQYHPRKQLRLQLARIMVLNLLNLYSLIFALFDKISDMTILLQEFKNLTKLQTITGNKGQFHTTPLYLDVTDAATTPTLLFDDNETAIQCDCNDSLISKQSALISLNMLADAARNLSLVVIPKLKELAVAHFRDNNGTEDFSVGNDVGALDYLSNATSFLYTENVTNAIENIVNETAFFLMGNSSFRDNDTNYFGNISSNASAVYQAIDIDDLKNLFVDYLTYILSPFNYMNSTILGNHSSVNYTVLELDNSTTMPSDDYLKTTVMPIFNDTSPEEEMRFETELTTMFSTTITSFPNYPNLSDIINETYRCLIYCTKLQQRNASLSIVLNNANDNVEDLVDKNRFNYTMNAKLRSLCWETMFGQELIKLTVMDLIMTGLSTLAMDFFRGLFVRVMNRCWCWDLEKKFPQYGDFKVAENILHLVNNQGMVWMGMFFSPGLVALNVVKLYVMMYLRAWAVLTCNVPHEVIFRASRSNNFYYALLLMMLFLCVLPVGYAIVWIEPSWHCGPFSGYQKIFHIFTNTTRATVPVSMHRALDYIASPGIVIPLLLLLVLIIYYLISLTNALREANNDLKIQLRRERTEERRKMFQMADRRRRGGSSELSDQTPMSRWKNLLGNLSNVKSNDETHQQESDDIVPSQKEDDEDKIENKGRVFFSKLIKKALGKSSTTEEEQDATDIDQHDSLPYDVGQDDIKEKHDVARKKSSFGAESVELQTLQSIVSKAWSKKKHDKKGKHAKDGQSVEKTGTNKEIVAEKAPTDKVSKIRPSIDSEQKVYSLSKPISSDTRASNITESRLTNKNEAKRSILRKIIDAKRAGVFDNNDEAAKPEVASSLTTNERSSLKQLAQHQQFPSKMNETEEEQRKPKIPLSIDSESSIWSENIPVITISDESAIATLRYVEDDTCDLEQLKIAEYPLSKKEHQSTAAPKIKCALKKTAAIDEDVIIHFSDELQKIEIENELILKLMADEEETKENENREPNLERGEINYLQPITDNSNPLKGDEPLCSDRSTSEDTCDRDNSSLDTILNSPYRVIGDDEAADVEANISGEIDEHVEVLKENKEKNA